ncbi:MAG: beta strand repeat-containing protein, partial [Roseimicrobium sp.]
LASLTFGGTGGDANSVNRLNLGSSGAVTFGGDVTYDASSNTLGATITGTGTSTLVLPSARIFNVQDSSNTAAELTVTSTIAGIGGLTKQGSGTLVLNGLNTNSGTTTVTAGNLQVGIAGLGSTGTGALTVAVGATVSGSGVVNGVSATTNHSVLGSILPGDTAGTNNGRLSFTGNLTASGSLVFGITDATGTYAGNLADLDVVNADAAVYAAALNSIAATFGSSAPANASAHDRLAVSGTLTLESSSQIVVAPVGSATLALGNVFNLIDATSIVAVAGFSTGANANGTRNGGSIGNLNLPLLDGSLKWDVSNFVSHGLLVVVDPPVTWNGGAVSSAPTSWSATSAGAGNWLDSDGLASAVPASTAEVVLAGGTGSDNMVLGRDMTVRKLTVTSADAVTLRQGHTLTLTDVAAAIDVKSGSRKVTINNGLVFGNNAKIAVNNNEGLALGGELVMRSAFTKGGTGDLTLTSTSQLAVGGLNSGTSETLQLKLDSSGGLVLQGTVVLDLFGSGNNDRLSITGELNNVVSLEDTKFVLNAAPGSTFNHGDSYDLLDWSAVSFRVGYTTGAVEDYFTLPDLGESNRWDLSRFVSEGVIFVAPEPSRALLLLLGLMALFMRRRRTGEVM